MSLKIFPDYTGKCTHINKKESKLPSQAKL